MERLRFAAAVDADERCGLGALERVGPARQGKQRESGDIGAERKRDAAGERKLRKPHQRRRAQPGDAKRSVGDEVGERALGVERGQEQQIEPDERADDHARRGAARRAAPPDDRAEERRQDLRDRRKRQQADGGERLVTGKALVEVADHQHKQDRAAPDRQHVQPDLARRRVGRAGAPSEQDRHDEVVGRGDGERDAVDDDHAGRRGEAAQHRCQRNASRAGGKRQREHGQVAIDGAVGNQRQPGDGERHDKQVDQDQIDRKQRRRRADIVVVLAFDDRDVELARQQQNRARRDAASSRSS